MKKIIAIDADASNIAEFTIGASHTIPGRLTGTRYDCAILGYVHIGLGRNTLLGGNSMSRIRIGGIMTNPTVELDGKTIVKDGKVLVWETLATWQKRATAHTLDGTPMSGQVRLGESGGVLRYSFE